MANSSRLKKLLLFGIAGLVVVVLAAALLIPLLWDVDKLRPKIESLAQEKLGREVEIGELGLRVLPTLVVTIDGIRVADGEAGSLLKAEGVRLGADLLPLLSGQLAIGRVVVEQPEVTIRRTESGEWELAELLGEGGSEGSKSRVTIKALSIEGGRLLFEDASVLPGKLVRHELSDLNLDVRGLDRLDQPLSIELSAQVPSISNETRVAWSGKVARDFSAEGELELAAFELSALAAHASALAGRDFSALAGRVDARLDLEWAGKGELAIDGRVAAKGLVLPREGAAALQFPEFELDLDMDADAGGSVVLDRFDLDMAGMKLAAKGALESEGSERRLSLELPETTLQVNDLRSLLRQTGAALPLDAVQGESVRVGGKVRAVANMDGGFELRSVDLDGLTLAGLQLAIQRGKDGRFDFQGSGSKSPGKKPGKASSVEIAARDIRVSDLGIRFEDRAVGGKSVVTEVTDVELTIDRWLPGKSTPLRVAGRVAGGRASLDGSVGPIAGERIPVDLQAKLEDIEIAAVAPYLAHYAGLNADRGRLKLDSRLRGDKATEIAIKGRLALEKARVELEGREPLSLDLTIDHDLSLEKGGDRVRLRDLTLGLPGGPVGFDGLINLPKGAPPSFDVGTRGSQRLKTDDLRYLIGLFGATTGLGLDAGEPLVLDARLKKRGTKFEVAGSAKLRKLVVQHALLGDTPLRVARTDVTMKGDRIELGDLLLQLGETDLSGTMSLTGFDQHRMRFDLRSKKADLDELFSFAGRTGEGAGGKAKAAEGSDALGRTRATGRLRVEQATLKNVALSDFDAQLDFADRRLQVTPASLRLYGGRADANLSADFSASPVSYEISTDLEAVQVQDLLRAGLGYEDLSGVGGGTLQVSGQAGKPEAAIAAATGAGKLELKDGVLGGLNMLDVLKDAGAFGEQSLAEVGARLSQEGTSFERLDADYSLSGGVLKLDRLFTETPDAKVTAKGPVRLLEKQLDLDVVVTFQRELSEKMREEGSRAARLFWNEREQAVRIPLKIVGPLEKPKGVIDWGSAAEQAVQGELGRQLGDALGGLLGGGKKEEKPSEPSQPSGRSPSEPDRKEPEAGRSAPASGAVSVELKRVRTGGNFLVPDVKVEAALSGKDLSHALIVVKDGGGRELHRDESGFKSQVDAHYAAGADRRQPTIVNVSWKLDGDRVAGKRDLKVSVTPVSRAGERGETVTKPVKAKSLF